MRKLLVLAFTLLAVQLVGAQQHPPTAYQPLLLTFHGSPTGTCEIYQQALNDTNGLLSTCNPATKTWTAVSGSPGGSVPNLQFKSGTGTLAGSTFAYNAAGSCQEITISCDNISNDGSVPGSGFAVNGDSGTSESNYISAATTTTANGGGMLKVYTASSNGLTKNVGPNAVAGFFRASVATVNATAVAIEGRAATFASDATNGQFLYGLTTSIAINKTTPATFITEGAALVATAPACDFPSCSTIERAHNLYGLKILDQNGFGTVEQAAVKILAQTPGAGTTNSVLCDAGCGIAKFGDGVQVRATAFASLPACAAGTEGLMRAVTDSTTAVWGNTITGTGANHVLGYCDGTNWTVAGK